MRIGAHVAEGAANGTCSLNPMHVAVPWVLPWTHWTQLLAPIAPSMVRKFHALKLLADHEQSILAEATH